MNDIIQDVKQIDFRYEGAKIESAIYHKESKRLEITLILSVHFDERDQIEIIKAINRALPFVKVELFLKKIV